MNKRIRDRVEMEEQVREWHNVTTSTLQMWEDLARFNAWDKLPIESKIISEWLLQAVYEIRHLRGENECLQSWKDDHVCRNEDY